MTIIIIIIVVIIIIIIFIVIRMTIIVCVHMRVIRQSRANKMLNSPQTRPGKCVHSRGPGTCTSLTLLQVRVLTHSIASRHTHFTHSPFHDVQVYALIHLKTSRYMCLLFQIHPVQVAAHTDLTPPGTCVCSLSSRRPGTFT